MPTCPNCRHLTPLLHKHRLDCIHFLNRLVVRQQSRIEALEATIKEAERQKIAAIVQRPRELLSPRAKQVAILIGKGFTPEQIAETLQITIGTVKIHKEKISNRLLLSGRNIVEYCKELAAKELADKSID